MRRLLVSIWVVLLVLGACVLTADGAAPTCGKPHKPPCPTTTTPTSTTPLPTTRPPPQPTQYRIAVLLINFADDSRQPWTTDFIDSLYDGPGKSVANFWQDASWEQIAVSADVFGWFPISVTTAECPSSQNALSDQADAAATAAGVDLSQYTNRVYLWPANGVSGCRSGGAFPPGFKAWIALQTTCTPSACAAASGLAHEFGHNLGLDHAGNAVGEYTDGFDVMGCCGYAMTSNIHRAFMGWIPSAQVITVNQSSTLTVTAANDQASNVYRVADGTDYYYLENRAIRTIWENGNGENWIGGKLLIRVAPDYTIPAVTTLLDLDPGTSPTQVGLPVGSSYTMPNGVVITNLAFDGINNTVQVTF